MGPNTIASAIGGIVALSFLWLFLAGVGYPDAALSLLVFFLCVVSAATLMFYSRRWLVLASCVSLSSLAYSFLVVMGRPGPLEYASAGLAGAYVLASAYAYSRFGKTKYLTPLDMPVYG